MIRRVTSVVVAVLLALALGGLGGLVIVKRLQTGAWRMPDTEDVVAVTGIGREPRPVSRTIYLARAPLELGPGVDDAAAGTSSVIAHGGTARRRLPGWKGSDKNWHALVACVKGQFAPFAIEVTDTRPATDEFILVAVGGKPSDIGVKDRGVAGLAPFSGAVIPRAVVFAFAAAEGHKPQAVCETIAMEVAHAYGLDHEYLCSDVMTYLRPCGKRRFVDQDARCGEKKPRDCAGGAPTQNSYQAMTRAVGARK